MGASLTLAGESLIAQKQAAQHGLAVVRFIFANVPGLDPSGPVDRAAGKPPANQIVYTATIPENGAGYVNPNQVVYSVQAGSDVGDWDFNWIGLETAENVLFAVAYVPIQQKRKNIPPLQIGNNLTRNFLVVFDGAQALTGLTIDASTWQHDFTVRLAGIDERERLSNRDIYGRACFFDSSLQLEKVGSVYQLKTGTAYVEGIRVERSAVLPVAPPALPTTAWLDVALQRELNDVVASWSVVFGANKVDYLDSAGAQHYCVALADIPSTILITDRRPVEPIGGPLVGHFAARTGDYAQLRARATTKDDVGLGNLPNAKSDDTASNDSLVLATTKLVFTARTALQTAIDAIINGTTVVGKAAKLATSRTITLTGDVTGSVAFDGSGNVSMVAAITDDSHGHLIANVDGLQAALDAKLDESGGTVTGALEAHTGVNGGYGAGNGGSTDWGACIWGMGPAYDGAGANATYLPTAHYGASWLRAAHDSAHASIGEGLYVFQAGVLKGGIGTAGIYTPGIFYGNGSGLTTLNASNLASGTLPDARLSGTYTGVSISGNAGTATKLATPRTISLTGDVTGSVSFDGSGNAAIAAAYKNSGVAAGTYRSVTVDAKGNVTAGSNPTTLAGYGINDAVAESSLIGAVEAFARSTPPAGWLKANGAAVSRTTYADLFAAIGTTFGAGNGSTTFNLPDMRGEFVRGWDDARGVDASRAFGSAQAGAIQSHTHGISVSASEQTLAAGSASSATYLPGSQTGATGGSETRPRNIALLYCIKY